MDYKVDFGEVREAGREFTNLGTRADGVQSSLASVPLSQPDFGRIPWLQTRVWEAFQEHTNECKQAITDMSETLRDAGTGLESTAEAYEQWETDAAEAISKFFEGMCG